MKQSSSVSKKQEILLQKVRSNSYYFGRSQSYYLYEIHVNSYQVPKGKQNGISIRHSK